MTVNRVGLQQNFIALKTILIKETLRFMRIWSQTLFPPRNYDGVIFFNLRKIYWVANSSYS